MKKTATYYIPKKVKKVIWEEAYEPVEYDPDNPPKDFYEYTYEYKNYMMIQRPFIKWEDREENKPQKKKYGKWETAFMSDRLWGEKGREADGVVNPVNGKRYDSKSRYYKDLRASGHHISDAKVDIRPKEIVGDFNVREELTKATRQVLSKQ